MNCGKNVRLKPTKIDQRGEPAPALGVQPAGDLRPPVVQAAHVGHDHAADHDVVEVGDDEVGVVDVDVDRQRGQEQPGQPADREQADEARARTASASANEIEPLYSVAVQLKTLIADGTATR